MSFAPFLLIAMGLTVLALIAGLILMVKGGSANKKYATKLMSARVALQGVALVLILVAVLAAQT